MTFFENEKYWRIELANINSNIPKKRRNLLELLNSKEKSFETKDGNQKIPENELIAFSKLFNIQMYEKIKIPIVLLQKKDHFVTGGNKLDLFVVELLMGYEEHDILISIQFYSPKHSYYYSYQVNKLRRKFPNIIQVVYSM